ncbi:MAG: hypothetical protein H6827_07795 [Planctomycetes bacterium]|nr:hypothetical protein [Planctomycetota bacterium]HPF14554.1 hypothetical protein [Planctomycetota bacterium]
MKPFDFLLAMACGCAFFLTGCNSTPTNTTIRDGTGNYVTTSDFRAMDRVEFFKSMDAGVKDFDAQVINLRKRANELGGDSLGEFADSEGKLVEERTAFANQVLIAKNSLDEDWPDEREKTVKSYESLREGLSEAYDDVLDR